MCEQQLHNNSEFHWILNQGDRAIRVGVHILGSDGKILVFDNSYRVPENVEVESGGTTDVEIRLADLNLPKVTSDQSSIFLDVGLLREGVAWFSINPQNTTCKIRAPTDVM